MEIKFVLERQEQLRCLNYSAGMVSRSNGFY
jgi:hypothetical protein